MNIQNNRSKFTIIFILFLTMILALTACQPEAPAPDSAAPEAANTPAANADDGAAEMPSSVVVDIEYDPATGGTAPFDTAYFFETLVDGEGAPLLAESGEISDDELDYIFTLHTGVLFQDGSLMDADAVIANFNRWFDAENELRGEGEYAAWKALFGGFKGEMDADGQPRSAFDGAEKVNNFTVLVHLNRPVPELMNGMSNPAFAILSPTSLAEGQFVGTGPYIVGEANADNLLLEPFANYWLGAKDESMVVDLK